jgi:hypothetical protein
MAVLGHPWDAGTAGFVERGDRNVTYGEMLALALVFGRTLAELLDPSGVDGSIDLQLDLGPGILTDVQTARMWVRGDMRIEITGYEPKISFRVEPSGGTVEEQWKVFQAIAGKKRRGIVKPKALRGDGE